VPVTTSTPPTSRSPRRAEAGRTRSATDELGRDVFSRVIAAAGVSLRVGVIAVGISLVLGVTLGLRGRGSTGRFVDDAVMRLMVHAVRLPAVLLAMAILAVLGPGITNAMIAIGIVYLPIFVAGSRGPGARRARGGLRDGRPLGGGRQCTDHGRRTCCPT